MKQFALIAAFTGLASSALAGGINDPIVEPDLIVAETTSSSDGIILPLILSVLILAAAAD